ncbi:hypothetical protein NP493_109g04000 [Ridgeia piscesae]|uniref:Uncharacterized protein n=1 Tax=Ridgeia piscesae TaxID=27915 RepID=A0AAD9P780_RIDPI|nr:hypothetical protein NP493_109g04000 [Ridgeia piscesae]
MRMYSKMPGSWYAVSSKRVNSHNVIDIEADVVHKRMSNLSYSVERLMPSSQASPYSHVKHSAFYIGL